jgi:hypothetical protein
MLKVRPRVRSLRKNKRQAPRHTLVATTNRTVVESVEPALVLKGQVGRVEAILRGGVCGGLGQEGRAVEMGVPGDRACRSCRRGDEGRSGGEERLSRAGLGRSEAGLGSRLSQSNLSTQKLQNSESKD